MFFLSFSFWYTVEDEEVLGHTWLQRRLNIWTKKEKGENRLH